MVTLFALSLTWELFVTLLFFFTCFTLLMKFFLRGLELFYIPSTEIFSSSFLGQGMKQTNQAKTHQFFL